MVTEPMPTKQKGESERDYLLRLRAWNIKMNKGGSRIGNGKPQPKPAEKKKPDSSGTFVDKILRGLGGGE